MTTATILFLFGFGLRDRITAASVVDHVEPHHDDPVKFWTGEVQSLCATCHSRVKATIEKLV